MLCSVRTDDSLVQISQISIAFWRVYFISYHSKLAKRDLCVAGADLRRLIESNLRTLSTNSPSKAILCCSMLSTVSTL